MTEEEAKTKACCGPEGCGTPVNDGTGRLVRMCIASACMGWRWDIPNQGEPINKAPGYCGLASRP